MVLRFSFTLATHPIFPIFPMAGLQWCMLIQETPTRSLVRLMVTYCQFFNTLEASQHLLRHTVSEKDNACNKEFIGQGGSARFDGISSCNSKSARGQPLPPRQVAHRYISLLDTFLCHLGCEINSSAGCHLFISSLLLQSFSLDRFFFFFPLSAQQLGCF